MGRPLPTSAWDILPFLQAENIYDCEDNNLEILKQAIIDEIVGLRSDVVRLHEERERLCARVAKIAAEATQMRAERDEAYRAATSYAEDAALFERIANSEREDRERLRDALEHIRHYAVRLGAAWAEDRARTALGATSQTGDTPQLCDCERSHNGLGISGRECDCEGDTP